uniref:Fibronectin type-III domain-containing protein n=1 Tax=Romanomermis culicivorax TaxID=13658 RepID=A0A915K239_ROMCU
IGTPHEIHELGIGSRQIAITWRPPSVTLAPIDGYKLRHSGGQREILLRLDEVPCHAYQSPLILPESFCYTLTGLNPRTTYDIEIQAKSGEMYGPWSAPAIFTTTQDIPVGKGLLEEVYTDTESIKVRWESPSALKNDITYFVAHIRDPIKADQVQKPVNVSSLVADHHFRNLKHSQPYNISVEGGSHGKPMWFISRVFRTRSRAGVCSEYIEAPSNLMIVDKTDQRMRISWSLPASFEDDGNH